MNGIKEFFSLLNLQCKYLILRNWDNVLDEKVYESDHADIDILCYDLSEFIKLTDARRIHKEMNRDNYHVKIGGKDIRFDIRWPGDGYYPKAWEYRMLSNRVLSDKGVYIMDDEDYLYSLSYHALLQKKTLSDEYLSKIVKSREILYKDGVPISIDLIIRELSSFMENNNYRAEIPLDPGVFVQNDIFELLPHNKDINRIISRKMFGVRKSVNHFFSKLSRIIYR